MTNLSLFASLIIGVFNLATLAQADLPSAPALWERYNIAQHGISVLMPKMPVVIANHDRCVEREQDSYYAYSDGVVYEVTVVAKSRDGVLNWCSDKRRFGPDTLTRRIEEIRSDKFRGVETTETTGEREIYKFTGAVETRWVVSDMKVDRWVELAVYRRTDAVFYEEFLKVPTFGSFTGRKIGDGASTTLGDPNVKGGAIPTFEKPTVSDSLWFIAKPKAAYTDAARDANLEGSVTLKVTLLANGTVGSVTPVTELKYGLTEQAIAAAKKIVFLPKRINGIPISVTTTFQYGFNIY